MVTSTFDEERDPGRTRIETIATSKRIGKTILDEERDPGETRIETRCCKIVTINPPLDEERDPGEQGSKPREGNHLARVLKRRRA